MKKRYLYLYLLLFMLLFIIPSVHAAEPTSISVEEGTYNSGDLDSLLTEFDDDYYSVTETPGAPALDIRINFTGIVLPFYSATLRCWHTGQGGSGHEAYFQLWNYTSGSWDSYNRFYDSFRFWEEKSIIPNYQHYVSNGLVQSRIYIDATGNVNHDFLTEFVVLNELDYTASRGEILAAALVASLILVPLLILVIFAARRKR